MKTFKIAAFIFLSSALTGCASHHDVKVAKEEAIQIANEANRKADEALAAAREANNRSLRTEEMLNRSFKKSMYK